MAAAQLSILPSGFVLAAFSVLLHIHVACRLELTPNGTTSKICVGMHCRWHVFPTALNQDVKHAELAHAPETPALLSQEVMRTMLP